VLDVIQIVRVVEALSQGFEGLHAAARPMSKTLDGEDEGEIRT
jgi:hypothetical protein